VKTRRDFLITGGAGLCTLAAPLTSRAQQMSMKIYRIGFLGLTSAAGLGGNLDALRAGLRDAGYVEGKNALIEYRWAEGKNERLPELVAELLRLKIDVIVTHGTPGTRAASKSTRAIPIVMAISGDAVANGLVASLARPGGNVTGSTFFSPETGAKRLDLLKQLLPRTTRVAFLINPANSAWVADLEEMETTARSLKLVLVKFEAAGPEAFESAFASMAKSRIDALTVHEDAVFTSHVGALAGFAAKHRLPAVAFKEFAEVGGLLGYGVNRMELWRRAAYFVDRIFKGTKAADLPIERATHFETILNQKTARALGITVPQSILVQATKVIE